MDQQPASLGTQPTNSKSTLTWVLIGVLGIGALAFAILSIVAFSQAHTAKTTVEQQKRAAATAARDDQKKLDTQAAEIAAESPYRSYAAPVEYGSFEIKFPKNWSSSVDQEQGANTQVTLIMHPNFIRRNNGVDDLVAAKVLLIQRALNDYVKPFQTQKNIKSRDVTVAGIKGVELTGKFSDRRTTRMVVVPIRDKSLAFINEDAEYAHEFDEILAQSKALP